MDGLLIDSEPFWREAESEVFGELGLVLTPDMFNEVMGLRIDEVVKHWYTVKPWGGVSLKDAENKVLAKVECLVNQQGKLLEGVIESLEFFAGKDVKIACASASPLRLIDAVLNKFELKKYFRLRCSAQFEQYGKPNPAIYMSTAKQLSVEPTECLVFEDSFNGLIAAKAARMKTIAVPAVEAWHKTQFDIADFKLHSLLEFNENYWEFLNGGKP